MIVDLDATIVEAHSPTEGASPTFKRTIGGRANANNAGDQIALVDAR